MLASLETQSGLAPGSHRTGVTNRCAALATTVGMVAGVHDGTTAAGTNAHVALAASLAQVGHDSPRTPWGKPAMGLKTRKHHARSNKFIVKRANG